MPATIIHKNFTGADAVHPAAYVQSTDPGSVGANKFWIDTSTSPPALKFRNAGNTSWTLFASGSAGATGAAGTNGATGAAGPPGTNIVSGAAPYICIQDQKAQNTAGGTFTSGAWRTRDLNTPVANDLFLASLATNVITLPAGTYRVRIICPALKVDNHQARLNNNTDGTVLLTGTSAFSSSGGFYATSTSEISGRIQLGSTKTLSVQHQCQTTASSSGLGSASNFGTEIYTNAEFWLEGPPPPFMGRTFDNPGLDQFDARLRVSRTFDMPEQGAFVSTSGPF